MDTLSKAVPFPKFPVSQHTLPRIHKNKKILLEQNHVITIEPGIYIPNWGGVRIEDDCLIEVDRCIPMNQSTKDLISI